VVLSPEEAAGLLDTAPRLKYKAALSVAYGAGLRATEVISLKVCDIDSRQMIIRVEQGKGGKDRNVMLSPSLRPTTFITPRSLPKRAFNAVPQQTVSAEIPIASDAHPRHTSRGFLPWRFAYAGPRVRRATVMGPPSANLHNKRHRSRMAAQSAGIVN
jgi:integrase